MKLKLLLFIFFPIISFAQTFESEEFEKKLLEIEKFSESSSKKIKWLEALEKEIKKYDHQNMINKDRQQIEQSLKNISSAKKNIVDKNTSYLTSSLKKNIKELKDVESFVSSYNADLTKKENIKTSKENTKRLNKFIELIDKGKYGQASIMRVSLPKREKEQAKEYEKLSLKIIRDKNIFENKKNDIIKKTKKINRVLDDIEVNQDSIEQSISIGFQENDLFDQITQAHKKPQFDVTISEFESGLFNCKETNNPKFIRYKNFPNLIALVTKNSVKSILRVDPNAPNEKNFVYACKKFSSLGGCIDNREKEICKIDPSCEQKLSIMEDSFDLDKQYYENKDKYLDEMSQKMKTNILNDPANPIYFWNEKNLLGNVQTEDLFEKIEKYTKLAKNLEQMPAKEFYQAISEQIKKDKNTTLKKFKNKIEYRVYEYFYNSMDNFFKDVLNVDRMQSFIGKRCSSGNFCVKYKDWIKAKSVFDDQEEIENLTMYECPRLVIRFDDQQKLKSEYGCKRSLDQNAGTESILDLNENSQKIINAIKKEN